MVSGLNGPAGQSALSRVVGVTRGGTEYVEVQPMEAMTVKVLQRHGKSVTFKSVQVSCSHPIFLHYFMYVGSTEGREGVFVSREGIRSVEV